MKKSLSVMAVSIILGVLVTFFILNKQNIYAKEEYQVYAFQVGSFTKKENAIEYSQKLPSSIIIFENNQYKIYASMYKNIDMVNKMVVYLENNDINVYIKAIPVSKSFYNILTNYEKIALATEETSVYDKINQSILNAYLESYGYENYMA